MTKIWNCDHHTPPLSVLAQSRRGTQFIIVITLFKYNSSNLKNTVYNSSNTIYNSL